jgi:hypothetical protein
MYERHVAYFEIALLADIALHSSTWIAGVRSAKGRDKIGSYGIDMWKLFPQCNKASHLLNFDSGTTRSGGFV